MKHQLIELLKKVNDGASSAPTMVDKLVHQYQMMSITFAICFFVLLLITVVLIFLSVKAYKNGNTILKDNSWNDGEPTIIAVFLWFGLGMLVIFSLYGTFYYLTGAVAPDWAMLNSLVNG